MVIKGEWYMVYAHVIMDGTKKYSTIFINAPASGSIDREYRKIPGSIPGERIDVVSRVNPRKAIELERDAKGRGFYVQHQA